MGVMRRELEVPLQPARISIESDQRARVEVISWTRIAVPVWSRISDAPVNEIRIRIVRPSHPRRTTASFPGVAFPRLVTGLTRSWDRVEAPYPLAGLRVVSIKESPDAGLTAAH